MAASSILYCLHARLFLLLLVLKSLLVLLGDDIQKILITDVRFYFNSYWRNCLPLFLLYYTVLSGSDTDIWHEKKPFIWIIRRSGQLKVLSSKSFKDPWVKKWLIRSIWVPERSPRIQRPVFTDAFTSSASSSHSTNTKFCCLESYLRTTKIVLKTKKQESSLPGQWRGHTSLWPSLLRETRPWIERKCI